MEITRDNYEIYFLDYYEGNLSDDQKILLYQFLEKNPDLKAEFELFSDQPLEQSIVQYPQKQVLQHTIEDRPINNSTIDEYCIAYLENDLKDDSRLLFEEYLESQELGRKIFATYKKTLLKREIHLYPQKKELLKPEVRPMTYRHILPFVAAAIGIIFVVILFLLNEPSNQTEIVQENANISTELEKLPPKEMKPIQDGKLYNPGVKQMAMNQTQKTAVTQSSVASNKQEKPALEMAQLNKIEKLPPSPIHNNWHSKAMVSSQKNQPLASRTRPTRDELSIEYIKKRFIEETEAQKLDVWRLADAGLKGLGIISESEFDLNPSRNEQGKIESITFSTDNFTIKAPLKSKSDVTN